MPETSLACPCRCLWLLVLLMAPHSCCPARILAVVATPSISHELPLRPILLALARRGHHITSITTAPMRLSVENYTEVDMSPNYEQGQDFDFASMTEESPVSLVEKLLDAMITVCDQQLSSTRMKEFLMQQKKFDLMIMEKLPPYCYYGLAHKVGSPPLVGYISLGGMAHERYSSGCPVNPAYIPDINFGYTNHMTFFQRIYSLYHTINMLYLVERKFDIIEEKILRKHFGEDTPSIKDIHYNFSLLLTSNHFSMSYPSPNPPSVIELTGLHIQKDRGPLPKDIKEFLDGAKEGVVYLSLGSIVKSSSMSSEKLSAFMEAFAQFPQRVLWKWEADVRLPAQPKNVMTSEWVPQQDVLAHQNLRLFITQGGLQSLNEAAYFGVPVIGIPFFGDQFYNIEKVVAAGIGKRLNFNEITADTIFNSISAILNNKSYRQNMERFSAVYREHQETSLERAVWWVEYVLRHRGAPQLRSAALDLHWWQLLLLDVAAFLLLVTALSFFILYKIVRCLIGALAKRSKKMKTGEKCQ